MPIETTINRSLTDLHPAIREDVFELVHEVNVALGRMGETMRFEVFETYRSPERQAYLLRRGDSKSGPWQSAHQYGLAADIVPQVNGRWTWDVGSDRWTMLATYAVRHSLSVPISWDRAHVQSPLFGIAKGAIRTSGGST